MNRSSSVSTGTCDPRAERLDERLGLPGLRAALAAQRQREPDDDQLGLVVGHQRDDPVEARLARRPLDDPDRPCQRPRRVRHRYAGARGAVVQREHPHRAARIRPFRLGQRLGELPGVLAARASHRRTPAAAAAHERCRSADHVGRADPVRDRFVEVRDERHLAVSGGAEHHRRRCVALLEPVGEVEERVALEAVDGLHDDVDAVDCHDHRIRVGRRLHGLRLALQLAARLLELGAQCVEPRSRAPAMRPKPRPT